MSFGAGWTAANNWQGDYEKVGDLSAYDQLRQRAYLSECRARRRTRHATAERRLAPSGRRLRPVITTEIGWETTRLRSDHIAQRAVEATLDGIKNGDAGMCFYGLYDDGSGQLGLFNHGRLRPPGRDRAHNLTTLLPDTGANAATFAPRLARLHAGGRQANDNTLLMQKSDGSYWLSLWNEIDAAHNVTLTLPAAAQIKVFDPLKGTGAIQNLARATSATLKLSDHPMLVEVVGGAAGP